MDDALYGSRSRRGEWAPFERVAYPPLFTWPMRPAALLRWLVGFQGYIVPWNLFYALVAAGCWLYLTPPLETMQSFAPGWILFILVRNAALILAFYGAWHLWLYVQRAQGTSFKFSGRWPSTDSAAFLFRNQTIDNMIWTFGSGLTIWTAYEVLTMWAFANGHIPYVDIRVHPVYVIVLMFLIPLMREFHFYVIHRALHWPPLYRLAHKLHHYNANPGPWSGIAMHPVEHVLYFSGVLIHWIVPSHPMHAMFHLIHAGLSPAHGHTGFAKLVLGKDRALDVPCYAHYLHHKYFECNYADGAIPLDKWFGTFHDGSPEALQRLRKRVPVSPQPR
jgi:sterol desaturase/sphingolipid hydroxylase (fatty acid hydroxylase superfamily)